MTDIMDRLLTQKRVKGFVVSPHHTGQVRVSCVMRHDKWLKAVGPDDDTCVRDIEQQIDHNTTGPQMPDLDAQMPDLTTRMPGFD